MLVFSIIKEDIKPVNSETKCDNVTENSNVVSNAKSDAVVFAKPEAAPRRAISKSLPSSRKSSSNRGDKPKHSGEDILEALRRAAAKQAQVGFLNT